MAMAMDMEEGTEVLEPYDLHYADLISLSSSSSSSSSSIQRLGSVASEVMEALGPNGPGLLSITNVPNTNSTHRNTLLPLARHLSLLPSPHRARILKDHGLGSDVPLKNADRCVSSFAMQLKYGDGLVSDNLGCESPDVPHKLDPRKDKLAAESVDSYFKDLSGSFRELGFCMVDLGLRLARICDRAIGGEELERSLLESGTAKGRLIHYHSYLDARLIKESGRRMGSRKGQHKLKNEGMRRDGDDGRSCEKHSELWQQWHYDYGTFTVLTSPMFINPRCSLGQDGEDDCAKFCGSECPSPSGHTYLQIFHPTKNRICSVKAPPRSFIIQVGESADILSRRKLRSTLHSVSRPAELESLSRETFVVFLHPAWNKVFDISYYPTEQLTSNGQSEKDEEKLQGDNEEIKKLTHAINEIIPPLSSRLKDGMTFAEFSRETTKQYYGASGLQSNR